MNRGNITSCGMPRRSIIRIDRAEKCDNYLRSCVSEGLSSPPDERKGGYTHNMGDAMCVTYSDLVQIGILIVALIGLCYTIFRGKRK